MLDAVVDQMRELHLADGLDILLVTTFFYSAVALLRRTQARLVAGGILMLGALYLVARGLDLRLTTWLLQGFFAVFLIMLVVIFQEELRQLFERLAMWSLRRRTDPGPAPYEAAAVIARCAADFARRRIGALIVLAGRQPIERHLHGGVALNGKLSEPLLQSIFDPHSRGHDGAVIVDQDIVVRFAAQLPLSTNFQQLGGVGTRHGAALGLAERTDAFCLVVSEERGEIAVAHAGTLRTLYGSGALEGELRTFLAETFPSRRERRVLWSLVRENWLEKIATLALVIGLWYLFVPGSRPATMAFPLAVKVVNVPPGYALEGVDPPQITAFFTGQRRAFYLFDPSRIDVTVDATLAKYGRRTFPISEEQIRHPPELAVDDVRPEQVRISLRSMAEKGAPAPAETPQLGPVGRDAGG
ncbi:MAG: diadenylate cyclase [Candidatus Binatia bacterium]